MGIDLTGLIWTGSKIAAKTAIVCWYPPAGTLFRLTDIGICIYNRDYFSAAFEIMSNIAPAAFKFWMTDSAKDVAKTSSKLALEEVAKQQAKEEGKEAIKNWGSQASKVATKKVGEKFAKEFAIYRKDPAQISRFKKLLVQFVQQQASEAEKDVTKKLGTEAGKIAKKKLGEKFAKNLAICGKDAAKISIFKPLLEQFLKQEAKEARKEATKNLVKAAKKKVGRKLGENLAKGIINHTVDEVWAEGTKKTAASLFKTTLLGSIIPAGPKYPFFEHLLQGTVERDFEKVLSKASKETFDPAFKEAVKNISEKEFRKCCLDYVLFRLLWNFDRQDANHLRMLCMWSAHKP